VVEPIAIPKRTNTPAQVLFPTEPTLALLASLATFGIAFLARPIGSALFGHFGDRVGRKTTLVASLLTMGLSTLTIGLLPTVGWLLPVDGVRAVGRRAAPHARNQGRTAIKKGSVLQRGRSRIDACFARGRRLPIAMGDSVGHGIDRVDPSSCMNRASEEHRSVANEGANPEQHNWDKRIRLQRIVREFRRDRAGEVAGRE
jgi:hypothetical protein